MRTSIFMNYSRLSKSFKEDLEFLWNFPEMERRSILPYLTEIYKTETEADHEIALDKAIKEIGGNAEENLRIIKSLLYIYSSWNPVHDTPSNFVKDLEDLHLIPVDKREDALAFLLEFFSIVEADNARRLKKASAGMILPSFIGLHAIVDFRPIIKQPFGTTLNNRVENYNPECMDFIPIFIVQIERDTLQPETFEFQCEEDDLDKMINSLQAVKKDLEISKKALFERRDNV